MASGVPRTRHARHALHFFLLATSLLVASMLPAVAETPAKIRSFTQENLAACKGAGGTPKLLDSYLTKAGDLNGDGTPDYVTDLAGLECANAWSLFCGSAGCPVTVWLSGPKGYTVGWGGSAQGWTLRGQEVVLSLHGQLCKPPRTGAQGCKVAMRFDKAPKTAAAPPASRPPPARTAPAPGAWQVRKSGDGPAIALAPGVGSLSALTALCLRDRPVFMVALSRSGGGQSVPFTFEFPDQRIEVTGVAGTATQKTYLLDPRSGGLAAALSGDAAGVTLHIGGEAQGVLSLNGSSQALRAALSPCMRL